MPPDSTSKAETTLAASFPLLERSAAAALILALVALVWVTVEAYLPGWVGDVPAETGAIAVVLLLTAALVLVSAMALRQTRT